MMNINKTLIAAAILTLGAAACDRSDKASTTNTTSAETTPNDLSTMQPTTSEKDAGDLNIAPTQPVVPMNTNPAMQRPADPTSIAGVNNRGSVSNSGTPLPAAPNTAQTPNATNNTAPGHIMFPPDKTPMTDPPNSQGTHDMGSGAAAPRR